MVPTVETEPSLVGRSKSVNSIIIEKVRILDFIVATNRLPLPIGTSESSETADIFGLYRGSLRSSATTSKDNLWRTVDVDLTIDRCHPRVLLTDARLEGPGA